MTDVGKIIEEVTGLLGDGDGHGIDHVLRVRDMAMTFAVEENADTQLVELASLLHDVDDYKMFGEDSMYSLANAKMIMRRCGVNIDTQSSVIDILRTVGYSKFLDGTRPSSIEGMVVSDADMCDAIGAQGILRTHAYAISKGNMFYDPNLLPNETTLDAGSYRSSKKDHSVQHFFDKLLLIPSIMMTDSGKNEAQRRNGVMVEFLKELFREEGADVWSEYLEKFIMKHEGP